MQVKINGKSEEIQGGSVLDLLKTKNIEPQMVAVEVNDNMLERDHLATTTSMKAITWSFSFTWEGAGEHGHAQRHHRADRQDPARPAEPSVETRLARRFTAKSSFSTPAAASRTGSASI